MSVEEAAEGVEFAESPFDPTCDTIGGLEGLRLGDLRFLGLKWLDLRTNPGP
jgi:hypothetical protein